MKPVKDVKVSKDLKVKDLISQFSEAGGFSAKLLADGARIWEQMQKDKTCTKFLSFPACIIATGTRGIIKDLVKEKKVDVLVTTCGTLDHDLARVWKDYFEGYFEADDATLRKKGINRLGNVFVPNESYGLILEQKMQPTLQRLYGKKKEWAMKDLIWAFGEAIAKEKNAEDSIIYWAWKNKIPVFIPGPFDGAFGSQLWLFWQDGHKDFKLDLFADEHALYGIINSAKKTGALMLGGGISKHHVIWWNQFRDGLDFAIQISTAPEWDGSLSGARTREAISWGKIRADAKHVSIPGDATILLPLVVYNSL